RLRRATRSEIIWLLPLGSFCHFPSLVMVRHSRSKYRVASAYALSRFRLRALALRRTQTRSVARVASEGGSADSNPFRSSRSERRRVARLCVIRRSENFLGKIQAIYKGKCAPITRQGFARA